MQMTTQLDTVEAHTIRIDSKVDRMTSKASRLEDEIVSLKKQLGQHSTSMSKAYCDMVKKMNGKDD